MELRHLRYFVLVAEELHFGRAAQRAGIAQPPLSQQIRALEAELGVALFFRTRRHVELTDAGRALLPRARQLLRDAERATQAARDGAAGLTGTLRIGFPGSLAFGFAGDFVRRHRERSPDVSLELRELTSEQQRAALHRDELDIAFVRYPFRESELESIQLCREPLVAAVPGDRALAEPEGWISVDRLRDEPFVMFPRSYGPAFFDQVVGLCRAAGFSPRIEQEVIQMPTIVSLVASGVGVAVVPGSMRRVEVQGVDYHELRGVDGTRPRADVYLTSRSSAERSRIVANAIELARRISRERDHPA